MQKTKYESTTRRWSIIGCGLIMLYQLLVISHASLPTVLKNGVVICFLGTFIALIFVFISEAKKWKIRAGTWLAIALFLYLFDSLLLDHWQVLPSSIKIGMICCFIGMCTIIVLIFLVDLGMYGYLISMKKPALLLGIAYLIFMGMPFILYGGYAFSKLSAHDKLGGLRVLAILIGLFSPLLLIVFLLERYQRRHLQRMLAARPELAEDAIVTSLSAQAEDTTPEEVRTAWRDILATLKIAPGKLYPTDTLAALNGIPLFLGFAGSLKPMASRYLFVTDYKRSLHKFRTIGDLALFIARYGLEYLEGAGEAAV